MHNAKPKQLAQNDTLHLSTHISGDEELKTRHYDCVIVNDKPESPIGAVILHISKPNGEDYDWECAQQVILKEQYKLLEARSLFEKFPDLQEVMSALDMFSPRVLRIENVTPADDFLISRLIHTNTDWTAYNLNEGIEAPLAETQKNIARWAQHHMVGAELMHTANAILSEFRKLKEGDDPTLSEAQAQKLLDAAEKGPEPGRTK